MKRWLSLWGCATTRASYAKEIYLKPQVSGRAEAVYEAINDLTMAI
jgi:hypothetical protein